MIFRTTADNLMDVGTLAWVTLLGKQLCGNLEVIVDTTICGGAACDATWLSQHVGGYPVFTVTAGDVARRWKNVDWPLLGLDQHAPANYSNACPRAAFLRCWLIRRMQSKLRQLEGQLWPNEPRTSISGPAKLHLDVVRAPHIALNYVFHEPSLALWFEARMPDDAKHIWMVEDDAVYLGNVHSFFKSAVRSDADLISNFVRLSTDCEDFMFTGLWSIDTKACLRRKLNQPNKHQPGLLEPVHHWEHLARFSTKMIRIILAALDAGKAAHGELFAPTLCHETPDCSMSDLATSKSISDHWGGYSSGLTLESPWPVNYKWNHARHQKSMLDTNEGRNSHAGMNWCKRLIAALKLVPMTRKRSVASLVTDDICDSEVKMKSRSSIGSASVIPSKSTLATVAEFVKNKDSSCYLCCVKTSRQHGRRTSCSDTNFEKALHAKDLVISKISTEHFSTDACRNQLRDRVCLNERQMGRCTTRRSTMEKVCRSACGFC